MTHFNFNGIGVDILTYEDMFALIDHWIADKSTRSHHIACINAYCVALAIGNAKLSQIYNGADIVGPDGMPFVKWIRWKTKRSCDRFDAPSIVLKLAANEKRYSFYLYGGAPDVLTQMQHNLRSRFPEIRIVGAYAPPFRPLTADEDQAIVDEINRLKPDILCVGLGTPKQDYWIDEHLERIHGAVFVASGATFDFFGGRIKIAPDYIRNSGFEWLYRLFSKDFKRLWKRYTWYNALFLFHFFLQLTGLVVREPKKWKRQE